jgi:TRAP-type C4-dicarboxylate transport system permease small subunit
MKTGHIAIFDRLLKVMTMLSTVSLVLMMLVTVADVSMANMLHMPITGTFDLVVTLLVFAVFLGIPITFQRDGNIVVDVVDHFVSNKTIRRLRFLARILSLLFLLVLMYNMLSPALDAYKYGEKKPELGLPLFVIWIPILIGVALSIWSVITTMLPNHPPSGGEQK